MKRSRPDEALPLVALGVLAGVIGVICFLFWRNIEPRDLDISTWNTTDFATLIAGFGGAVMGGVISWVLARQTASETLKRDEADREEEQKARAVSVLLKTQEISNGCYTQRRYLWEALNLRNDHGAINTQLWTWVRPQVGKTMSPPKFEALELMPLIRANRADLINEIQLLALRYDVLENSFKAYNSKRERIQELMTPYSKIGGPGGLVMSSVPKAKVPFIELAASEAEALIQDIYTSVREDSVKANSLCLKLSDAFVKYFGEGKFIKIVVPDET